jgi:hypothetical protein
MFDMFDHKSDRVLDNQRIYTVLFFQIEIYLPRGPMIKRSKSTSTIVVTIIAMFSVNNNCHRRHIQKPFSCASDISFSNKKRRSSSVGSRLVDSTADSGRCYIIRIISSFTNDFLTYLIKSHTRSFTDLISCI